jgi:hypothetical protein
MREFVNIHIPGGVSGNDDVTDEVFSRGVIDTINMELLQSRELNRGVGASPSRRAITSPAAGRGQASTSSGGVRPQGQTQMPTSPSPEDWDINAAMRDARGVNTSPVRRSPGAVAMASSRQTPAADSPGSASNSGGVRTPPSGGRNGSDFDASEEGEDLEKVFQNDFFNSFFPYLRRKGSGQESKKDR